MTIVAQEYEYTDKILCEIHLPSDTTHQLQKENHQEVHLELRKMTINRKPMM